MLVGVTPGALALPLLLDEPHPAATRTTTTVANAAAMRRRLLQRAISLLQIVVRPAGPSIRPTSEASQRSEQFETFSLWRFKY
jgi:hypothetical protein